MGPVLCVSNERTNRAWLGHVQFAVPLQVLAHHSPAERKKCLKLIFHLCLWSLFYIECHKLQNVPPVGIPPWGKGYKGVVKIKGEGSVILQPLGEETPLGRKVRVMLSMPAAVKTLLALFSLGNKEWAITFIVWSFYCFQKHLNLSRNLNSNLFQAKV